MPETKRTRRWVRVSLRSLLIVVTITCLFLALWSNSARRQRDAATAIEAMGGKVVYVEPKTWIPQSFVDKIGIEHFYSVKEVQVSGFHWHRDKPEVTFEIDHLVTAVRSLSNCRSLNLSLLDLKDEDLKALTPLADQIEKLFIREVNYDATEGPGLVHIRNWSRLKSLSYHCRDFDSLNLSSLSTCPQLQDISLSQGGLDQSMFAQLAKCKNLTVISLRSCRFEGNFLQPLQLLPLLKELSLTNCSPEPFIRSFIIEDDGSRTSNVPMEFHFRGGDPQFVPTHLFEPGFPTDEYNAWKKKILPGVSITESFHS